MYIADGDTLKLDPDKLEIEDKLCVVFLHAALFRLMVVPKPTELNDLTIFFRHFGIVWLRHTMPRLARLDLKVP